MHLVLDPGVFALGVAVGVLGLVLLLSLLIAMTYKENTLLYLAGYLALMLMLLVVMAGSRLSIRQELVQPLLLVLGTTAIAGLQIWLLRNRKISRIGWATIALWLSVTLGLLGFYAAGENGVWALILCGVWLVLLVALSFYLSVQAWETAGPWKWWLLLGHGLGVSVAALFLTDLADAKLAYWPTLSMLLLQAPPIYLSLVWRSRLLNEIRLRSAAAGTVDPLTGLATTPVLVERLMRVMSRAQPARLVPTSSALFLIEVTNWNALLHELGPEFNEKLLLEAALRLRRSIGENDLAARIQGGRFAVLAQGLAHPEELATLASRLLVSGLRIDSPLLPGVEFKFHVIVSKLKISEPLALPAVQAWLDNLANRFTNWPSSHRSRGIWVVESATDHSDDFKVDSSY